MTHAIFLRRLLEAAAKELGLRPRQVVVLDPKNDAFWWTTRNENDAIWLAGRLAALGVLGVRTIHVRGVHYILIGQIKPDGGTYANDAAAWEWVQKVVKAARWLGNVPFEAIVDERNAKPIIRIRGGVDPTPYLSVGLDVDLPDPDDILPTIDSDAFNARQPYRIAFIGEKSSLQPILGPICNDHDFDLLLPTGEPSDTMIHRLAAAAEADGRKLIVFYFSDCDPSGWQMPISVAQKLNALKWGGFHNFEFEMHRAGLTPDQVKEINADNPDEPLPSSVLKESETRAGAWKAAMGVEQTEIDALAALRPELLDAIALDAIAPFWDDTLDDRVAEAYEDWKADAQAIVDAALDADEVQRVRSEAADKLAELEVEIDRLNDALHIELDDIDGLPDIDVPEPDIDADGLPPALIDSEWGLTKGIRRLKASKAYVDDDD